MDTLGEMSQVSQEEQAIVRGKKITEIMHGDSEGPKAALKSLLFQTTGIINPPDPDMEVVKFADWLHDTHSDIGKLAYPIQTTELLKNLYPEMKGEDDFFIKDASFSERTASWDTVFNAIYGDKWANFKFKNNKNGTPFGFFDPIRSADSLIGVPYLGEERRHKHILTKILAPDERCQINLNAEPLLGQDEMRHKFGIEGELKAMISLGDTNPLEGAYMGLIDLHPTQDDPISTLAMSATDLRFVLMRFEAAGKYRFIPDTAYPLALQVGDSIELGRPVDIHDEKRAEVYKWLYPDKINQTVSQIHARLQVSENGSLEIINEDPKNFTQVEQAFAPRDPSAPAA